MQSFYSNGKLLLTGEYAVLDGAKALALPTKFGQSLKVETISAQQLLWKSLDAKGKVWFEDELSVENLKKSYSKHENAILRRLFEIIISAKQLNSDFLTSDGGFSVTTKLDFPRDWGLGSSSTLINNIAQWAEVDPFELLELTFGGSGYDIACAQHDTPILYRNTTDGRQVKPITYRPEFSEYLYFVHLNKKRVSRDAIAQYRNNKVTNTSLIDQISTITDAVVLCNELDHFCDLVNQHEQLLSKALKIQTIKAQLFPDFNGSIKSLGAWGGDFVLAATEENPETYFREKGYTSIKRYTDMILQK